MLQDVVADPCGQVALVGILHHHRQVPWQHKNVLQASASGLRYATSFPPAIGCGQTS